MFDHIWHFRRVLKKITLHYIIIYMHTWSHEICSPLLTFYGTSKVSWKISKNIWEGKYPIFMGIKQDQRAGTARPVTFNLLPLPVTFNL
jgi:hypothetical protein